VAVSRTRRAGPVEGFWATVDAWAGDVVDPSRVHGWWASRCRLEAECGPYLDVLDDRPDGLRPTRGAVAARGLAVADDEATRAALADVEHRRVTAGRRYRWNGPALTPVVLELHTTDDEALLEAWWEDVWIAWPTIHLGNADRTTRSNRRATASAQINRLFEKLGVPPLGRLDDAV
jgi:hypothetical protein